MAQFRYRLQTLLEQRAREKEDAEHALATAQRELRREQEDLERCRREQAAAAGKLRRALADLVAADGSSGEAVRLNVGYAGRLRDEHAEALDATRIQELSAGEAAERVATARERLALRSRDVEVLEKHRARLEHRFEREAARNEALEQEEMATMIFLRGKKVP